MTNIEISDALFCQQFELKAMAGYISQNKLERWLPGFTDSETEFDHRQRYDWVCTFTENKNVLDMACGSGMGSYIIASKGKAKNVLGCDIDNEAIRYASIKNKNPNLSFEQQDATKFAGSASFDIIVSFETVEHIPHTEKYLDTIYSHLNSDGVFIVSTPLASVDEDLNPRNTFHFKEWGFRKFQDVISAKFTIQSIFVQLHAPIPFSLSDRIISKINASAFKKAPTILEEFNGAYPIQKFGKSLRGYQILVCKRK